MSTWRIELTFSLNTTKSSAMSWSATAERDPADEGRDQPVAEGDVGQAVGQQPNAERVDPLIAPHDAPTGEVMGQASRRLAEHEPETAPKAASPNSFAASHPASPPGEARMMKKRTKGSASPSLRPDSRLSA